MKLTVTGLSDMGMMTSAVCANTGLDLSSMCREPVFVSHCAQETQNRMTQELAEHELNWHGESVDTVLYRGPVGRLELYALRYGAEVEVRPRPFDDFVLVQMPLRGSATFESRGERYRVGAGEVAILSPEDNTHLVWQQGCEQLILRLPWAMVSDSLAQMRTMGNLPDGFTLLAVSTLQRPVANRWFGQIAELLQFLPGGSGGAMQSCWLKHLEESLPLFLLSHLSQRGASDDCPVSPRLSARQLHKLDAVMREHLSCSITLSELATAGGVSLRSLNTLCQREYGQSPMERLRNLRLEAARERLLSCEQVSVTQVALEFGFSHTGRFASYYRQRFGELPKDTALSLN